LKVEKSIFKIITLTAFKFLKGQLDENPKGCLPPTKAGAAPPHARARHPPPPQGANPAPSARRVQWQRAPERGEHTQEIDKRAKQNLCISLAALMFVKKGQLQALPPSRPHHSMGGRGGGGWLCPFLMYLWAGRAQQGLRQS